MSAYNQAFISGAVLHWARQRRGTDASTPVPSEPSDTERRYTGLSEAFFSVEQF
jgi:hypothetical protein